MNITLVFTKSNEVGHIGQGTPACLAFFQGERENGDRDTWQRPCAHGSRSWNGVDSSQAFQRLPPTWKNNKKQGEFSLEQLYGKWPC